MMYLSARRKWMFVREMLTYKKELDFDCFG